MLLCAVLLAVASIPVCTTSTVYVRPKYRHAHCPGELCYSLSHYLKNAPQYFASNTTMVFLNGTHYLEALQPLVIKNIWEFYHDRKWWIHQFGLEGLLEARSKIECDGTNVSGFNFIKVSGIHIENLTFTYCGQEVEFKVRAALAFDVAYNVNLFRVTVCNSSGFGLHGWQGVW